MLEIRKGVFLVPVGTGLLILCLCLSTFATEANLLAQEPPPQCEQQRQAREALNKGVQDFKNGQYDDAIARFRLATQLDPRLLNARLYLATAYASQYIPGAPSEENIRKGEAAVEEFRGVLAIDPSNLSAIDGIGSTLFQMAGQPFDPAKFQESKSHFQKHIQLKPDDREPYYWVGVIDWTLSFLANKALRAEYNRYAGPDGGLLDTEPLPVKLMEQYEGEYGPTIDEGIGSLKRALELRPDYDDAMAYLNLLYRRKADTVASQVEREELSKMADDLVDKVKEIKQKRAEQPSQP